MAGENKKKGRNRRVKLGILALALTLFAYTLAKITGDASGEWFKFALLVTALTGLIGGQLTFTDVLLIKTGKKD